MSVIALILGWTKLPAWVQELIAIAILLLLLFTGVKVWDHRIFEQGVAAQQATDLKRSAADAAVLEARATTAEKNYATALTTIAQYNAANPLGAVRLCVPAAAHVQASPTVPNSSGPAAGPPIVPVVPPGDSGGGASTAGPDVSGLLSLLALRAAQVDAQAIELQGAH